MAGFYNLYLPTILLMRSGDIEINPGPNTPESMVSEEEFILLSELIDPSKYNRLGNRLGMTYAVLKSLKIQAHDDYSNAFMEVFTKWRNKQLPGTDTRAILAEELQTCGLGELSGRLLDGSLLSNATSKPLVPPASPPSPPRQPLSPELIQKCAEDFKFEYGDTLCKIRADPLNPDSLVQFEDMYTNLVLEEEDGRCKQVLEYSDLVNLKGKTKFSKRLLVQGEAGAGKTTLCSKIAWDWINGKHFQQFVWVIIVPLREAKKYSIGEIAKSYLTSNNPTTASQLTEYMHLNTDKVFIVLDGLDEFDEDDAQLEEGGSQTSSLQSLQIQDQSSNPSGSTQYQAGLQSASSKKKASSGEMEIGVEEILRSEKLETAPVLVTTRPWKAVKIRKNDRLRKKYTFLYVQGFSQENVESYIKKYFVGDKAKAESLIQFANDNDVISENMAPYPIFISMLCLMWREFGDEKQKTMKALQTFSQIFEEIFVFLKEHYALKMANPSCSLDESLNKCLKDVNKLLEPIASLALDGLLTNTLVFREGDFERLQDSMKTACRVGVLSEECRIILGKGRRDASNPRLQPTVFFPHKLFQEFIAGIHLASLYETNNREYNRLMEIVTGHRMEEFRYLLYFTASQNQKVGIDVLTLIGRSIEEAPASRDVRDRSRLRPRERFLVDVAFECHDTHAAAVIKDKVSRQDGTLVVNRDMTAHTVAGYAFIKPEMANLTVERKCGPTMSHEVAEMVCSLPSLRKVVLSVIFQLHNNFVTAMAAKGRFSKVQSLTIKFDNLPGIYVDASTSHDLAEAVGTMPSLTDLTLNGVNDNHRKFISKLKSVTLSMKVQSLTIKFDNLPGIYVDASTSHDLAEAVGTMPNLTDLTLEGVSDRQEDLFSKLKSVTPSMKVQSLTITFVRHFRLNVHVGASALQDLVVAVGTMPNLTDLTLVGVGERQEDLVSKLKSVTPSMKIQSLVIGLAGDIMSESFSHDLGVALISMPNLTKLTLNRVHFLKDDFFSTLKSKASSMKIQSLRLSFLYRHDMSTSASHDLSVAMATMPDLTELTVKGFHPLISEFFSTLGTVAASMKDCFPQIATGNFHFNGTRQECLESFMHELSNQREVLPSFWEILASMVEGSFDKGDANQEGVPESLSTIPSDPEEQYPSAAPTGDNYDHHSTPDGLTSILAEPGATDVCEPVRSPSVQEDGNRAGMSDDSMYSGHSDPASQEYFQYRLLPDQVGNKSEYDQFKHSVSSPVQVPQPTRQHSHTHPLPPQGPDSGITMPSSAHHLSGSVNKFVSLSGSDIVCSKATALGQVSHAHDRSGHGQQSPQTAGSSSGRSQGLKRTAPCTQSRVPDNVPEKQPRVDILEESPSVHLCDYSSSDESSASKESQM